MPVFGSVPSQETKSTNKRQEHNRQKRQHPARRATATSRHGQHDKRVFSEATQSRTFQLARFLGRRPFNPLLLPRSIADNGSSWRRGAAFALHRRQRVLMETGTLTMFSWKLHTSLCCEHVCRQLPEASKSRRTICIRCQARQSTECGKMFGSHFQKNLNIMYFSGETTDIEHEQK